MPYLGDTVTWLSNKHIDPDTPAGLCKALGIGADICLIGAKKLDAASSGWDLPDRQILAFHALERFSPDLNRADSQEVICERMCGH